MPVRVKYKPPPPRRDLSPVGAGITPRYMDFELPQIGPDDEFQVIVTKLSTQVPTLCLLASTLP